MSGPSYEASGYHLIGIPGLDRPGKETRREAVHGTMAPTHDRPAHDWHRGPGRGPLAGDLRNEDLLFPALRRWQRLHLLPDATLGPSKDAPAGQHPVSVLDLADHG